jgi:prevent-host-death family protein
MAAEQGIQIAEDGVAEVSMTDARANLTQLIREVRYGGRPAAFTERKTRSAYVVPPEFYEQLLWNRGIVERLRDMAHIPAGVSVEENPDVAQRARIVYEALESVERDMRAPRKTAES